MDLDWKIYRALLESDDAFITDCNIQFINGSVPLNDSNGIYVAFVGLDNDQPTLDGDVYRSTVDLYVKTKNTDYLEGSRFLRSVMVSIRNLLISNDDLQPYHPRINSTQYEYGDNYENKGLHIVVTGKSLNVFDKDYYKCLCEDITDLEVHEE